MDLTSVEGLADLLGAETEAQRDLALRAAGGGACQAAAEWIAELRSCLATVEVPEEEGLADTFAHARPNALRPHLPPTHPPSAPSTPGCARLWGGRGPGG